MKSHLCLMFLVFYEFTGFAQENMDLNFSGHTLQINVPELALLDIYDSNSGNEAGTISMNITNKKSLESGEYQLEDIRYDGLYLNYTSVVGNNISGVDITRQINVKLEEGSTFPENLDLIIIPKQPVVIAKGGTTESAGRVNSEGIALGDTNGIGTEVVLVSDIGSLYTGDKNYGVQLSYSLKLNSDFTNFKSNTYQARLKYTLSDL